MLNILLNAEISSPLRCEASLAFHSAGDKIEFAYDLFLSPLFCSYRRLHMQASIINVKIAKTRMLSAGVKSLHTSIASQRLHAGDLNYAYLVGLIEGDGYFSITKNGKYLTYELGIELSIRDVQLIYKIKDLLGVGVISFRKRKEIEMVSLRVRNKDHLKNFIIPIFDKYPMFSNKQYDYLRFKNALLSGIIYYQDLPEYIRSNKPINSIDSIINATYFSCSA